MPLDLTNDQSTLVQVMAWCRQATSHYLNQCWHRFMSPYNVNRPQWVNFNWLTYAFHSIYFMTYTSALWSFVLLWLCYSFEWIRVIYYSTSLNVTMLARAQLYDCPRTSDINSTGMKPIETRQKHERYEISRVYWRCVCGPVSLCIYLVNLSLKKFIHPNCYKRQSRKTKLYILLDQMQVVLLHKSGIPSEYEICFLGTNFCT